MSFKEELARAIATRRGLNPDTHLVFGDKPIWKYFVDDVEAVLERLQKPSDAMKRAGADIGEWAEGAPQSEAKERAWKNGAATDVYVAMIEEAGK